MNHNFRRRQENKLDRVSFTGHAVSESGFCNPLCFDAVDKVIMIYRTQCHAYFALSTIIVACIIGWLIAGEASPFRDYFIYHVTIPNAWRKFNLIPYMIAIVVGSTQAVVLFVYYLVFTIQWALIGLLLSSLICRGSHQEND